MNEEWVYDHNTYIHSVPRSKGVLNLSFMDAHLIEFDVLLFGWTLGLHPPLDKAELNEQSVWVQQLTEEPMYRL